MKQRTEKEIKDGVKEWVEKKFRHPKKLSLINTLWPGEWSSELVLNNVKSEEEVTLIENHGINIIRLQSVISQLESRGTYSAAGADFVDLVHMGSRAQQVAPADAKKRRG